jgi:hypothetical protein
MDVSGQSFMTKMCVKEIYKDVTITDTLKVVWMIGNFNREVGLIWGDSVLHLTKETNNPTKQQRLKIKEIRKKFEEYQQYRRENRINAVDNHMKIRSLYMDNKNHIYYVTLYMKDGITILINRVDGRFPCYFFRMVN